MKFTSFKKTVFTITLTTITLARMDAQKKNTEIIQDPIVHQLLNEKRKINTSLYVTDKYKIQIFTGSSELAKKTLNDFKAIQKQTDATIVFQTPNYKVWIGNFRNRMEAERNMLEIKKKYPNSLLIKPSK
ncbi:SPOR domain-containing protein [Flavobacterium sp. TSSA_36]|uniref:SPOR domain-containing protein n=1 Tax=Flavobacterium sp. TSSA_36 TaxID=3447669 RepID=UPI003F30AC52